MRKEINDGVEASTRKSEARFQIIHLMLGKPCMRLNNLNTCLRFPCLGLNIIIDYINFKQKAIEVMMPVAPIFKQIQACVL